MVNLNCAMGIPSSGYLISHSTMVLSPPAEKKRPGSGAASNTYMGCLWPVNSACFFTCLPAGTACSFLICIFKEDCFYHRFCFTRSLFKAYLVFIFLKSFRFYINGIGNIAFQHDQ